VTGSTLLYRPWKVSGEDLEVVEKANRLRLTRRGQGFGLLVPTIFFIAIERTPKNLQPVISPGFRAT
jgi:hypothetical protein